MNGTIFFTLFLRAAQAVLTTGTWRRYGLNLTKNRPQRASLLLQIAIGVIGCLRAYFMAEKWVGHAKPFPVASNGVARCHKSATRATERRECIVDVMFIYK
jgi:hypothetical protein